MVGFFIACVIWVSIVIKSRFENIMLLKKQVNNLYIGHNVIPKQNSISGVLDGIKASYTE